MEPGHDDGRGATRVGHGLTLRRPGRALLLSAAVVAILAWGLMSFVERLIFQPGLRAARPTTEFAADDVFLETEDGVRIHAYWLAAEPEIDRAILFLHGNAGDASRRLPNASSLRELGAHVLLVDYRGYGLSEGHPSEEGVYADARAALAHLEKERGIPTERIIVFGRSLGGAVAVHTAQGLPLAGLVVESTFTSVADIARTFVGVGLDFWLGRVFASVEKAHAIRSPVLAIHGDRDRVIRMALGRKLFDAFRTPKRWVVVRGGRHNNTRSVGGETYWQAWREFLAEVAPLKAKP